MKKLVIAIMLLAFAPTTAQAGISDILELFKKKPESRQEAAKKRLTKSKQKFLKRMEARRGGKSIAKKTAQKSAFKQRTATARDYTVKRSGMYPSRPSR